MMMIKDNFKLVISPSAIQYIYEYGNPIANYQFIGYIFPLNKDINGILSIDGKWGICTNIRKKPLNQRKANRFIKKLVKTGFLIQVKDEPFPEFEYYNNIKIDFSKIKYLDEKLFDNLED